MKKDNTVPSESEPCDSKWCEIRQSGIHGRGLFAKRRIPQGTPVIEYVGEKIDKEESDRRGWARIAYAKKTGDAAVYIFTLNDRFDIDGNVPWNAARLINHSCEPNCEAYIDEDAIWIGSLRDIEKGEELFYNYGFDLESWEDHPCRCGAKRCIGYIAGKEYWTELKRRLVRRNSRKETKANGMPRRKKGVKEA
ncbi:MAG: SET domain-containing protein-lysine N-methyltransferase [Verrucomicrobiae bacterium]|nr:SET domain-containing protein-lysine N-methyltransferase [Verrucomicrobiae bacterium]